MKKSLAVFVALVLSIAFAACPFPVNAQIPITYAGSSPSNCTTANGNYTGSASSVALAASSATVTIVNTSGSSTLYWSLVNPATVSNFALPPGAAYTYQGANVSTVYLIGSGSGTYSIFAH